MTVVCTVSEEGMLDMLNNPQLLGSQTLLRKASVMGIELVNSKEEAKLAGLSQQDIDNGKPTIVAKVRMHYKDECFSGTDAQGLLDPTAPGTLVLCACPPLDSFPEMAEFYQEDQDTTIAIVDNIIKQITNNASYG